MKKIINKITNFYLKITQPEIRIWSHLFSLLGWSILIWIIIGLPLIEYPYDIFFIIYVVICLNYLIIGIPLLIIISIENIILRKFQTPWIFIFKITAYKIFWTIGNIINIILTSITILSFLILFREKLYEIIKFFPNK